MTGKEKACICMYEHVIEDDQAPAACDAHKTRSSQSDEGKAACDFW